MPQRDDSWGSVVGEALGLVPLVGRVVREKVEDLVSEGRTGLAETLREVKDQLHRELTDREGPAGDTAESGADGADVGARASDEPNGAAAVAPSEGTSEEDPANDGPTCSRDDSPDGR
ncbi:MAG: hypothetical protein JW751_05760 [Polyangiaceae bacterium]|nr:hypothetical protein [Polyangiaceae bacterium]